MPVLKCMYMYIIIFILPTIIIWHNTSSLISSSTTNENAQNITIGPREQKEVRCAFWDFAGGRNGSGGWSFDGIEKVLDNGTHVQCTSKHLTSFVVLVSVVPVPVEVSLLPVHTMYS